ncbi:hypothetical protein TI39_contig4297g00002 [Zymoseptoria brevis]|uniref:Major facilitator superfamily (MFS) profile domain-containing protein n=1 Tax=Zymoseptoria brevis TaxID=1047168 RepID=A0A0F4GBH2_9PEZI|nr:hypothetical protein TI39_contig4297g00002 [Zymoseptoria brevis]
MEAGWFYSGHQIRRYFSTRLTSLRPPRAALKNPWEIVRELDGHQWAMFGVSFAAWTWDAFDFFTVGLCVTEIAEDFGELPSAITWGITITLMLRSVRALISGSIGDRYGRKWIMIANFSLFIILELPPSPDVKKRFDYEKVIGIYMGISFVVIMILVFLGPEMTQKERDEEASVVLELEEVRVNGRSIREIGRRGKTTAGETASSSGNEEGMAEKRVRVGRARPRLLALKMSNIYF